DSRAAHRPLTQVRRSVSELCPAHAAAYTTSPPAAVDEDTPDNPPSSSRLPHVHSPHAHETRSHFLESPSRTDSPDAQTLLPTFPPARSFLDSSPPRDPPLRRPLPDRVSPIRSSCGSRRAIAAANLAVPAALSHPALQTARPVAAPSAQSPALWPMQF